MTNRTYPYEAWVLTPSFKPKKVTIVSVYDSWQHPDAWDVAEGGKLYSVANEIFQTKEAAIAHGWERIGEQEAKLAGMLTALNKKRQALEKAAS